MAGIPSVARRLFAPPSDLFGEGRPSQHLVLIDGARGLAAAAVLFWHYQNFFVPLGRGASPGAEPRLPLRGLLAPLYDYGLYAVPIFWMISGFVLATVYYGTRVSTREFAVNRFARLYPLHFLTLCVVAALQVIAVARFGVSLLYDYNDPYHFMLQLLFASNWGFERGYSFNGPIWSVSVEVLIYALFWLSRHWLPTFGIAGPLLLAGVAAATEHVFPGNQIALCAFFFFFGVGLCGILAAVRPHRALLASLIGGLLVIGLLGFAQPSRTFDIFVGLPGVFGALIVLLAALERHCPPRLRHPLTVLGDNTYGMYLWHIPVQMGFFLLLARVADISELAASPWFLLLFVASVASIARFAFVYFERPMRRRLRQFGSGASGVPSKTEGSSKKA